MAQPPNNASHAGLFESIKGFGATGVAMVRTRLELLSTELAEEKERLLTQLVLGLAALFFIGLGIIFAALFLTVVLWDSHRLLALGMFTVLFLGLGIAALVAAAKFARTQPKLFAASLAELSKDQDHLSSRL
ncbi:phage holin family protein [Sulfurimicrobium lacus]|nr:phage holin family protein [Sulfurimicrobium lacus]